MYELIKEFNLNLVNHCYFNYLKWLSDVRTIRWTSAWLPGCHLASRTFILWLVTKNLGSIGIVLKSKKKSCVDWKKLNASFIAIEQEPITRIQFALVALNSFSSSWTLVNSNVLLVHVYLQITSSLPPSYAANLPHLIGISRTDIPLSPTSERYFDEGLNSIESTSNRGTSVQAKV